MDDETHALLDRIKELPTREDLFAYQAKVLLVMTGIIATIGIVIFVMNN